VSSGRTRQINSFGFSDASLELLIEVDSAGVPRLTRLGPGTARPTPAHAPAGLPLVDVVLAGSGRAWSGSRYCESVAGQRMRYEGHRSRDDGDWHEVTVTLQDPVTGLRAQACYRVLAGQGAVRSSVRLRNDGSEPVTVESVTSFLFGGLSGAPGADRQDGLSGLDLLWAENDWLAEGRWQRRPARAALPDLNRRAHGADPRGRFGLTSTGTWSSGSYLPMGAVSDQPTGRTWLWQIEHNGPWHWQAGECTRRRAGGHSTAEIGHRAAPDAATTAYVALLGPTDAEHQWHVTLAPGESFTSVPAAVAVSADGFEGAVARLTAYRRAIRRPHPDHQRLPVIFNDYMNTVMGDPTTGRLLPLVAAAASVGAEYFCIDAGWYAEPGDSWWDTVGSWRPSAARFPGGLGEVLAAIRSAGLVPGIWLEPEMVGVRSPIASRLPVEAFFARHGQRVVENGRYHLDFRHRAAVKHLDETIDFLVGDLGMGYLKFDYNINGGPGTQAGAVSAGAGLLAHNRAYLQWLDAVLARYPELVVENCASGGMRTDYALLSRLQVQSTSDQQDLLRYPPIMAAAPAAVAPEQAASWAYPQPGFSDGEIAFALCGALLGRVHLSGNIDRMSGSQRRLVADAVEVYKHVRPDLPSAVPFWPLGLPGWEDSWIALGMRGQAASYILVWRREGGAAAATLPVPHLRGTALGPQVLYPRLSQPAARWDAARGELAVTLPDPPAACLVLLAADGGTGH
jgi:alpha-galactosidase